MRLSFLVILTILFAFNLMAQKEYNIWYFGNYAGLDFNTCPPSTITNSKMYTSEASTSVCDSAGNLLFYTNGDTIWNRKHQLMQNWESLEPYAYHLSAVQGCLILPVPGNNHLYYLFLAVPQEAFLPNSKGDSMVHYWVIDMNGDGGYGAVTIKDKKLILGREETLAVTKHANGLDYWVCASHLGQSYQNLNCIRTTNGIFSTPPIKHQLEKAYNPNPYNIKFSPDSRIIYTGLSMKKVNNVNKRSVNFYRFDNATGQISQRINIPNISGAALEFSSSSNFFYTTFDSVNNTFIMQYDITIWDSASIVSSKKVIYSYPNNAQSGYKFITDFQLGPDGKIYCFYKTFTNPNIKLSVINYPNVKGIGSKFSEMNIDLKGRNVIFTGPYYPSFIFKHKITPTMRDSIICKGDSILLSYNAYCVDSIRWSTGNFGDKLWVKKTGKYSVIVFGKGDILYDTINVTVGPKFKVYIGNDTTFCGQFSHLIKASSGFAKYNWNTGSTAMQITVNSKGIYSVKVLDSNTCPSGDTIAIDQIKKPIIKLSYDSINCKYVFLSTDTIKGLSYLWSTSETSNNIKVDKKGWYSLKAIGPFCSNQDSIQVNQLSQPEVNLGIDTSLCNYDLYLSTKEQGSYLWSTGETRPSIIVNEPSTYWLTISRNNCSASDTINVKLCEDMLYYIPSIFTPNGDNTNDVFKVYGSNISFVEMEIYNRWGEKLLETSGKDANWDGFYKNELCMESVYFYKVKIKGKKAGSVKYLKGSITLLK